MASAAAAAMNKIERAHQMYREGRYSEALENYTEALAVAKTNPQKIALHSNRAACFLKLHHFNKAADECTSVLELDYNHTGALMLRAQTLVTLKEYHSALFDVNRLLDLNPSSEVYQNLQARLRTQLSLAPIPESEEELEEEEDEEDEGEAEENRNEEEEEDEDEAEKNRNEEEEEHKEEVAIVAVVGRDQKAELNRTIINAEVIAPKIQNFKELHEQGRDQKSEPKKISPTAEVIATKAQSKKESSEQDPKGWQSIPKPKGHSTLDYGRWDRVEDDSSEDDESDDDDEECLSRFRVRTIGVRPVK